MDVYGTAYRQLQTHAANIERLVVEARQNSSGRPLSGVVLPRVLDDLEYHAQRVVAAAHDLLRAADRRQQ